MPQNLEELKRIAEHDEMGMDWRYIVVELIHAMSRLQDRIQVLEEEAQLKREGIIERHG